MPTARAQPQPAGPVIYHATVPPQGATCDHHTCATLALVRVVFPRSRFDADGYEAGLGSWDSCDLHWPAFRDATIRNGHHVTDTTGDPRQLPSEFPGWRIFRSDLGRLYAARPGTTVYGWLTAQLRAEIQRYQAGRGQGVPGGPVAPGGPVVPDGPRAHGDAP
jgi:hypothetical protein